KPAVTTNTKDPDQDSETWRQLRKSRQPSQAKSPAETARSSGASENGSDTASVKSRTTAEPTASSGATEGQAETTSAEAGSPVRTVVKPESQQVAENQAVGSAPPADTSTAQSSPELGSASSTRKVISPPAADTSGVQVSFETHN